MSPEFACPHFSQHRKIVIVDVGGGSAVFLAARFLSASTPGIPCPRLLLDRQVALGRGLPQDRNLLESQSPDRAQVDPLGRPGDPHEQDPPPLRPLGPLISLLGEPGQEHAVEGQALGHVEGRDLGDKVSEVAGDPDFRAFANLDCFLDDDAALLEAARDPVEEAVRGHDDPDPFVEDLALTDDLGQPVELPLIS